MSTMSDFVSSNTVKSVDALSGRNVIRNGHMAIAQRGTSFPAAAHNAYSLDGWVLSYSTTGVTTISQDADSPSPYKFNSLKVTVTTADAAMAANEFYILNQHIEGHNVKNFSGRTFTLSFWVKSSKIGKYGIAFRNIDYTQAYPVEYTINVANTWEKKVITIPGGLPNTGVWDFATGVGIRVSFFLAAGSDAFASVLNAWTPGGKPCTSNQVNALDTVGATWFLTGVQLELGDRETEFELLSPAEILSINQRYYETGLLRAACDGVMAYPMASTNYSTTKRATPTFVVRDNIGAAGFCTVDAVNGVPASISGDSRSVFCSINNSVRPVNSAAYFNWEVSSEI